MKPVHEPNDEEVRILLNASLPPAGDTELSRDLWPQMRARLDEQRSLAAAFRWAGVPWFDWALAALAGAALLIFPSIIPALFYHL